MKISNTSDRVNSVRKQVTEAFALTTAPADNNLVVSTDALNASAAERMRQRLTGKRWQELDRAFLEKAWAAFCYLTAEAYRYFLPSLLICCLEDFAQHNDLLHSTIHKLTPSYRSIYYEGKDARFDYQISALNRVQYDAVCAFLDLIFDRIPAYRYNSAQALRWGWSRHETAAAQKCKKYYDVLHHYEYPRVRGKKKGALVTTIHRAFGQTPYPGDTNLSGSDQDDEPAECALELRGVNWKQCILICLLSTTQL